MCMVTSTWTTCDPRGKLISHATWIGGQREEDWFYDGPRDLTFKTWYLNNAKLRAWDHQPVVVKTKGNNWKRFKAKERGWGGFRSQKKDRSSRSKRNVSRALGWTAFRMGSWCPCRVAWRRRRRLKQQRGRPSSSFLLVQTTCCACFHGCDREPRMRHSSLRGSCHNSHPHGLVYCGITDDGTHPWRSRRRPARIPRTTWPPSRWCRMCWSMCVFTLRMNHCSCEVPNWSVGWSVVSLPFLPFSFSLLSLSFSPPSFSFSPPSFSFSPPSSFSLLTLLFQSSTPLLFLPHPSLSLSLPPYLSHPPSLSLSLLQSTSTVILRNTIEHLTEETDEARIMIESRAKGYGMTRASRTTKITSVCDRVHHFVISSTCLMRNMWDCHSHCLQHFILFVTVGSSKTSCCTVVVSIYVRRDGKGFSLRLSLLSFILLTCCRYRSTAKKNHISFVVSSLASSVISSRTVYTERTIHIHKVVAEQFVLKLVGNKVPLNWYCSRFHNADEWKWRSSWWLPYRKHEYNGRICGWSISRGVNKWMDSNKWNHFKNSTTLWWVNFLVQVWGAYWRLAGSYSAWSRKTRTSTEGQTCWRCTKVLRASQSRSS